MGRATHEPSRPRIANDVGATTIERDGPQMTVIELMVFVCVYRANRPLRPREVCTILDNWTEAVIAHIDAERAIALMVGRGWLIGAGDCVKATEEGREVARPLMNGLIQMLDQGTRLIDVALMMSLLRLTKGELDRVADH
jgi:hypothetical protein